MFGSPPFNRPELFSYRWARGVLSLSYVGLGKSLVISIPPDLTVEVSAPSELPQSQRYIKIESTNTSVDETEIKANRSIEYVYPHSSRID
jgi:hypothetical protein